RAAIRDGMKARLVPITICGGEKPHWTPTGWTLPKKEMVGVLQVLFQNNRLKVSESPERATLLKEFSTFRIKLKAVTGNESFEAWRESDHDDLVFAVALPCWLAEKGSRPPATLRVLSY